MVTCSIVLVAAWALAGVIAVKPNTAALHNDNGSTLLVITLLVITLLGIVDTLDVVIMGSDSEWVAIADGMRLYKGVLAAVLDIFLFIIMPSR